MSRTRQTLIRLARQRRGSVAVSFALNILPLLVFLFGLFNLGDLGLTVETMLHGVQIASRDAAVQTSAAMAATGNPAACATQAQILGDFNGIATPILPPATIADTGGPAGAQAGAGPVLRAAWTNANPATGATGATLTVTASFSWVPLGLPQYFTGLPLNLTATQTVIGTSGGVTSCV